MLDINLETVTTPLEHLMTSFPMIENAETFNERRTNRIHVACERAVYTLRKQDEYIKLLEQQLQDLRATLDTYGGEFGVAAAFEENYKVHRVAENISPNINVNDVCKRLQELATNRSSTCPEGWTYPAALFEIAAEATHQQPEEWSPQIHQE